MATKNVSLRLNENTEQSTETSTVWVSGKTVYGRVITASTSVVQEAVIITPYIYIEGETTHNASGITNILDQSKTFTFDLSTVGIQSNSLGTGNTVGHTTEHGDIKSALVSNNQLSVNLDGSSLEHIGTGYATNYIDVTGTSIYGGTIRATLVFRIELLKVTMTFNFDPSPAPSISATYSLYVDNNIVKTGSGTATVTYVSYSTHILKVAGSVSTTSSYDPQTINITALGNGNIIDPNNLTMTLTLPGNYGQHTSTTASTSFMASGTISVSFNWTQQYVYNVTTTQSGCKVVVGGLTLTESSSTNGTYTTSSVETSLSYTVSKYGYVTKTGTITGPNRSITVTLDQIVNETLTCNGNIQLRIQNNTQNRLEISTFNIVLNENGSEIASWKWQLTTSVDVGNYADLSPSMTSGMGAHTVAIGTTLTVTINAQMTNGSATELEFMYPSFDGTFPTITSQRTGDFGGSKNLPTITYSGGSGYNFPTVSTDYEFKATFSE